MLGVPKWIKWLSVAVGLVAMVSMWLLLKASKAEQAALRARFDALKAVNQTSELTINTLRHDQEYMNTLLVSRTQKQQQDKRQLDEQISELESQLENMECHIPDSVTQRLQQPY